MESRRKAIYKKKNLKQTACVSLFLLQVTVKATTGREEKRGGNRSRPPLFVGLYCGGDAWRRRAATVPIFPKVLLYSSWIFRGLFCNFFYMLEYVSKLLLVFCLIYVIL
jgi:hypothetical protein